MKISVVVPTYKREKDLEECLGSILTQTFFPLEIFVVDNAKQAETKKLVLAKKELFIKNKITLEYVENTKENSLTSARNLGVKLCRGEIVSFLDDDVLLDKNYFFEINNFFDQNQNALGMCGQTIGNLYEKNKLKFVFAQLLGKIFFLGYNDIKGSRVLPSLGAVSSISNDIVSSQWLSGASMHYAKKIFSEISFDENLKKYSWSEDLDFSYRVYKKYPNTLFFNPKVKYLHKLSPLGRTVGKEKAFMEEIYSLYLFYKLIPQTFKNKTIYAWGRIGSIIYKLIKLRFLDVWYAFLAFATCIGNLKSIKSGNLDFFNKTIK